MEGSFSVSPAGDATYLLSLDVPPGRNGMQPSIGIAYDSAGGDAVLGMGFSITGLSAITRCPRNLLQDGRVGGVTYGQADALCLDGQHLVMTKGLVPDPQHPFAAQSCAAPDCYEYRTQPDSFVRVLARYEKGLPADDGPQYFDVFTKSGLHLIYGDAPGQGGNANVLALNSANAAWWIAQSSDRDGNTIDYTYWNDLASIPWSSWPYLRSYTTEIAPKQITYTGHPTVPATRAISFVYDTKDPEDIRTRYDHGAPRTSARRLASISMSEGQTILRTYDFTYALGQTTRRTLLQEVEECSWTPQRVCKPPTIFTWSEAELGFSAAPVTALPAPESGNASVMPMDITGDGLPDLVVPDMPKVGDTSADPSTTLWRVAVNKGPLHPDPDHSPYFSSPFTVAANAPIPPPAQPGAAVLPELGTPIDYNHDGLTDLLLHDIHGQHPNWMVLLTVPPSPNKPNPTFKPLDTGIPRVFGLGVDTPPRLAGATASAHLADLDGNGVSDLIQCEEIAIGTFAWTVHLWEPGGFSPTARPLPPLSVIYPCDTELTPLDVDADGVIDLVLRETDQDPMGGAILRDNYITFSLVVASAVSPSFDLWSSLDLHLQVPPTGGAIFWMDVNGDSLPDAVETGFANHLPLTFLNTGDPEQMFAPGYVSMAADPTIDAPDALASLGVPIDDNGDGQEDLLLPVRMNGPNNPPSWVVLETSKQDPSDPASPWVFVPVVTSIPFDAQATLDATGNAKISLWDPHGPRVLDVDGDGAHDVLLPINGFFHVFRNKASDQDLLVAVTDGHNEHDPGEPGFAPTVAITYAHLIDLARTDGVSPGSPALDEYRYVSRDDPANGCDYPRACVAGPQRVVATYSLNAGASPKGLPRWRAYAIQYRDSRYHRIARRSLGFGRRIVRDLQTGAGEEEVYDNVTTGLDPGFPVPFAGQVTEERRFNPGLPTQPNPQQIEISSTTVSLQEVITQAGSNHFVVPAVREVRSLEGMLPPNASVLGYVRDNVGPNPPSAIVLSDTKRSITKLDGDGNALVESSSTASVGLTSTIQRQIATDPFTGLASEITDVHECSAVPGLQQCRTLHRTLDPVSGHVITETQASDDPSEIQETQVTTTFGYDLFGDLTTVSAVDADGDVRSTCISYFPNGFPFAHVNAAGHVVYTKYHPGYGVLLASVDANGLVTQWAHDGLGRVTEERRPDQTSTTTALSRVKDTQQGGVVSARGRDEDDRRRGRCRLARQPGAHRQDLSARCANRPARATADRAADTL
ncbi:MAG: SpvB/TcaC N-terminal domain-containing protein [Anaeromyxobacteraceae bacterium]